MNNKTASSLQERNASVVGQQVCFLDRDPVPLSLRGKGAQLEREAHRIAVVRVDGIRRYVPRGWLVVVAAPTADCGSTGNAATTHPALPQPAASDAEGDDDPITEQAWYRLLDGCLELNLSPEEAREIIAEATGIPPDELEPSRLTWRQYLQAIERLEQLEQHHEHCLSTNRQPCH
jgi:hypothetical protein